VTLAAVLPVEAENRSQPAKVNFAWLEVTEKCQLRCLHCYAASGPSGTHGSMTTPDWMRVIEELADVGARFVQFIGGEPTQHPDLIPMARFALSMGLDVEIFSHLAAVTPELWKLYGTRGVHLATSYYSDDPEQHAAITQSANGHRLTLQNMKEAIRRGISLRVGLIDLGDGQRVQEAHDQLVSMGVTEIRHDQLRQVGRGVRTEQPSAKQLCGNCTNARIAVAPDGSVWPCVFSRWLPVGNVREQSLADILASQAMAQARAGLNAAFALRCPAPQADPCTPDNPCSPDKTWENKGPAKEMVLAGASGVRRVVCTPDSQPPPPCSEG
jgi:MoaA/NifB/PqqE/SkfB family radical SAM enzyme